MSIEISSKDVKKFAASMRRISKKQMPFAGSKALNDTAFDIRGDEITAINKYIDRPIPFTKKGVLVKKATKTKLVAFVKIRPAQARYLQWQVFGGKRLPDNKAIPVPVGQKVNKYGNMSKSAIKNLIKQKKTFSGVPTGHSKAAGIYRRLGYKGRKQIKLMVAWEPEADYKPRLPFYEVANKTVKRVFVKNTDKAVRFAMRTAR